MSRQRRAHPASTPSQVPTPQTPVYSLDFLSARFNSLAT